MFKNKRGNGVIFALVAISVTVLLIYLLSLVNPSLSSLISLKAIVNLLVRSFVIFVFAFIMLRLLGKRQLSQLTFIDLLIIIALGSAVGDVMIYSEEIAPLINSVIAVGFIALLVIVINKVIAKHVSIGRLIEGRSTTLVKKGKILNDALLKESMNEEELRAELREHNVRRISELDEVILEPTGNLSIKRRRRKISS